MALGIACAGTGQREAIALLEPMAKFDPVNFVRQGALVSERQLATEANFNSSRLHRSHQR
jgi:26S proteasome regulatory subunit N2